MTRENKLALVVGFGLILFVGILISDHFSIVRNQQAADLSNQMVMEPTAKQVNDTKLIDLNPRRQPLPQPETSGTPAVSTTVINGGQHPSEQVRPEQRTTINPEGMPAPERIVMQPGSQVLPGFETVQSEPPAVQVRFHDVRNGETLFAICRQYYGGTSLVNALAQHNKMSDPAALRVGRRLMIPSAEELGGRSPAGPTGNAVANATQPVNATKPATTNKPAAPTTYTVKEGDSLAQIAQRFLGSTTKWKKLHDMNRDVIDDPDDIKVGTVLRVL